MPQKQSFSPSTLGRAVRQRTDSPARGEVTTVKQKFTHCIFLFLLGFFLYANSLQNGYVLDDSLFITGNNFTLKGFAGIKEIWTNDAFVGAHGRAFDLEGGRYRPLAITMFAIEYELFGLNPFYGHLINVILFSFTAVLLYLFLSKLLLFHNAWVPLIASVLFVIHPIHTEVVANIKSRDEILAAFFLLFALFFLLREKKKFIFSGAAFYFLSLLSKENTITLLAIIPVLLFFFKKINIKEIAIKSAPFLATAIIYLLLRTKFAGTFGDRAAANVMDSPYLFASFFEKYATVIYVCGKYLWMLFFPHPLSYDYSFNAIPLRNFIDYKVIFSLLAYGAMIVFSFKEILKKRILNSEPRTPESELRTIISFGILFYLITFSIVSNFFFNIGAPMGERFSYLPSIGFCIAFAAALAFILKVNLKEPISYKLKFLLPLIIIIPVASLGTIQRNRAWKDNFTLYKTDLQTVTNSARAQLFYGIEMLNIYYKAKNKNELQQSIEAMETSCKINPDFYHAFYNLGLAYQANEDHQKAVKAFERVLQIEPKHINSHYYLGMSYGKEFNQFDKAIDFIEKGLKYGYNGTDGYVNLGISYAMKGDMPNALKSFEKGISITPGNANLYLNLGITYDNLGEKEKAKSYYEKAFALDPSLKK